MCSSPFESFLPPMPLQSKNMHDLVNNLSADIFIENQITKKIVSTKNLVHIYELVRPYNRTKTYQQHPRLPNLTSLRELDLL